MTAHRLTEEVREAARAALRRALDEDRARQDVTTRTVVPPRARAEGVLTAHRAGWVAGLPFLRLGFGLLDSSVRVRLAVAEGDPVRPGEVVARVAGRARPLLSAERSVLNLVGRLSGIATLTRRFVESVRGTGVEILDTRKTTPGLRVLEKYAVAVGGGTNHRQDLAGAVLIKENHLRFAPDLARAVRDAAAEGPVTVEVETLEELAAAVGARAAVVLLDNFDVPGLAAAVLRANELTGTVGRERGLGSRREGRGARPLRPLLEASGGVTLETVRALAETGVDRISIGALTHSAPALDLSLELFPAPSRRGRPARARAGRGGRR